MHDANKTFTNIRYQAGQKHIPVGRIRNTDKLLPQPIRNKITHTNLTSKNMPQDPSIPELNKEISTLISTNKTEIWREHIEKPWDLQLHKHLLEHYTRTCPQTTTTAGQQLHNIQGQHTHQPQRHCKCLQQTVHPHYSSQDQHHKQKNHEESTQSTTNTDKHHN